MNPADSEFWIQVAAPCAGGAALSFLVERLLEPTPRLAQRPWHAVAAHLGLWTLAFAVVLLVIQRPYFAALLILAELIFLAVVSNAKVLALKEPFVFQDFEFFAGLLKHPRLILPYLGAGRTAAVLLAFGLALYLGIALEPGLTARVGTATMLAGSALVAGAGAALLWAGTPRRLPIAFVPAEDLRRLGQLASLWYYGVAGRARPEHPARSRFAATVVPGARELPHIVVVQSESFFDARRLYSGIRPGVLEQFDAVVHESVEHGCLRVPAWGGNTARTEFSFLTGIAAEGLGINRFNPYRRLARLPVPTLARCLRQSGYRTVCVHPYPASFYSRDAALPALGFDEFLDLEHFRQAQRAGPYVSDEAVAQAISALLRDAAQPALVFAITMENHGPLHLERVAPGDVERLYTSPPPEGYEELTVYLRHLANADRMIRTLREHLERSPRGAWLAWYGDHVPIMPRVYRAGGFPDGCTDYFIWGKGLPPGPATRRDIHVEELGVLLLERAGLLGQTGLTR